MAFRRRIMTPPPAARAPPRASRREEVASEESAVPDQALVNSDLQSALAEVRQAYIAGNPKSFARHQEACEAMPGGNTRTTLHNAPFPLTVVRGEGCRLWDADGHEYIDVLGEYTAGIYGHSHPVIRAAIDKALNHGWNYAGRNPHEARLAQLIVDRMPSIDLVRFTNSGTEGNVMALAGARVFAQRNGRPKATKVMVFHGGYHGGVLYFVTGGSPVNMPYEYVVAPYNDIDGTKALLASHGAEVMTSRLSPGGLQKKLGVIPDMTTLGKYIGGGMSFGAFGGRRDIMKLFDPTKPDSLPHAGTFNNNALTMAAGAAGYGEVYTPAAAKALNERGEKIRIRLNAICAREGVAFQFSGIGSMMTAHATARPIRTAADIASGSQDAKELFFFDMMAAGIWIARRGFVALNIMIGDSEGDRFVAAVEEFVTARKALLRPQ